MLTYPVQPSTVTGNVTVAQVLAFLKSPASLARRFEDILSAQNFISHLLLKERYTVQGGAIAYAPDEVIKASEGPETVAPGGEYPLVAISEDQAKIIAAMKKGFGSLVTDEAVGRLLLQPVDRAIAILANTIVDNFDSITLGAIMSAVTNTVTGGAWSGASAAAQVITDVEKAKASLIAQRKGYTADTIVLTPTQYAAIAAPILSLLPRESSNPILTGSWPNLLGLTWVTNENLPSGWTPTVLDSKNLGGIAHEVIPSPEYVSVGSDGSNVEVARYREKTDSTRIQVRKADVPVIRNPAAGVEITGTGLS